MLSGHRTNPVLSHLPEVSEELRLIRDLSPKAGKWWEYVQFTEVKVEQWFPGITRERSGELSGDSFNHGR